MFGRPFRMKLDDGQIELKSYMGASLSILLIFISLIFTLTKVETLWNKHDVDIMSALDENVIDFNQKFTVEDGLFVAAAISEYDSNPEVIEEARYG